MSEISFHFSSRAPLHKTVVTLPLTVTLQTMVIITDFLTLSRVAMVVTIDWRVTINGKGTIALCNGALISC